MKRLIPATALAVLCVGAAARVALIVNAAQPITDRISVNLITVADDNGANAPSPFGDATQQAAIFADVNTIYAQAGVTVDLVFRPGTYNSTFALTGTPGNNDPRPGTDLPTIVSNAKAAGVLSTDPNTINALLLQIVPGSSQNNDYTANGLSFVAGNGITYYGGASLAGTESGQEVLAAVLAHEIGHNLGLQHVVLAENLMQANSFSSPGQRLNAGQISTILSSPLTVPVPEPTAGCHGLVLKAVPLPDGTISPCRPTANFSAAATSPAPPASSPSRVTAAFVCSITTASKIISSKRCASPWPHRTFPFSPGW